MRCLVTSISLRDQICKEVVHRGKRTNASVIVVAAGLAIGERVFGWITDQPAVLNQQLIRRRADLLRSVHNESTCASDRLATQKLQIPRNKTLWLKPTGLLLLSWMRMAARGLPFKETA